MTDTEFQPEFRKWPSIPRLFRGMTITEKIDGTNAGIHVSPDGQVVAQSRNRLISPESDNQGFARWVADNAEEIAHILGPGLHYGEWWGKGIQRSYGLDHRVFSLFNTDRFYKAGPDGTDSISTRAGLSSIAGQIQAVPVLFEGPFHEGGITNALISLREGGSAAAEGFMKPEGIVVYHSASKTLFKVTLDNQDRGKWESAA